MLTVDIHAHVLLPGVLGACGAAGPELGRDDGGEFLRAGTYTIRGVQFSDSPMSDPARRITLMDRLGITRQIVSPYPMLFFYDQPPAVAHTYARKHNDEMAALVRRHADRLDGFACLPMQEPDAAVDELRRAVRELGLVGSYVGCRPGGRDLSDPAFEPLWAEHCRLGVPVVVHPAPLEGADARRPPPWDLDLVIGFSTDETTAVAHLLFGGVLDRHPSLTAIIPHGGGFAPFVRSRFEIALAKRAWGKGLLRRPFAEVWNQLVFDCLVHDEVTLEYLVRAHGADRIVLGTNFAAWDQDNGIIARVAHLPIPAEQRAAILGGNVERLLRL
jgi:aminocarboxymuconate-semialdehyde decarboxylase